MKQHINALTATRAIAAIMVFIHHFGGAVFPFTLAHNFFDSGNLAVSYFFVLSGFVLCISYRDKKIGYGQYIKRRLGRIAPVYLLALFLFIVVSFCFYNYVLSHDLVKQIVYSTFFIQAWFPDYALTLNAPAWSISVELFFYLLFPFLLLFQKKNLKAFIFLTVVFYLTTQVVYFCFFYILDPFTHTGGFVYFNPVMHISQFMIGMAGACLLGKWQLPVIKNKFAPVILLCIIIVAVALKWHANVSYHLGLIAPLFMLFILSVATNNPRFLNFKPLVFLGEASYGIYILQFPVHHFLDAMNKRYMHLPDQYFFYFALIILALVASASYSFFESPIRRKINSI